MQSVNERVAIYDVWFRSFLSLRWHSIALCISAGWGPNVGPIYCLKYILKIGQARKWAGSVTMLEAGFKKCFSCQMVRFQSMFYKNYFIQKLESIFTKSPGFFFAKITHLFLLTSTLTNKLNISRVPLSVLESVYLANGWLCCKFRCRFYKHRPGLCCEFIIRV